MGLFIGWMISFYCNTNLDKEIIFLIFDFLICKNYFYFEKFANFQGVNFIEYIIAQNLIFFFNAQSVSRKNLQDNVYEVLKKFEVEFLKDFDFKIILKKSYLLFYKDIFLDD